MTGGRDSEPAETRDAARTSGSFHLASEDGRHSMAAEHEQVRLRPINWLSRLVARIPVRIRTKFLISLAVMVVVLVIIGGLGLRVLGESNARFGDLATTQKKAATYRSLQDQNSTLRSLVATRTSLFPGVVVPSAETVESTLRQLRESYDLPRRVAVQGGAERKLVAGIRSDYEQLVAVMTNAIELDRAGRGTESQQLLRSQAVPLSDSIVGATDQLASTAEARTASIVSENRDSYNNSRLIFLVAAAAAILLALLLGFAISSSLSGPVQRMDVRLAELAEGDFSQRVDVPNRDELGTLAANLNRMNDELGELYRKLETASRAKSDFLANMSHELRTPLNAIIGFSEVLLEQMFGPLNDKQAEYLGDIVTSGRHLLLLINDTLDLSKIEAGKMELELAVFALPAVLEDGVTMVRERATRHGIECSVDAGPDLDEVEADERKVKQVVFNLLSNAVKFTPDGGRVEVRAWRVGDRAEVAVSDTGVGIDPADQDRIFQEFQQAGQQEGSGLGLALARSIVALHGGDLWVKSESGSGSTFFFTLPVRQTTLHQTAPPEPAVAKTETAPVPARASKDAPATVLLIEDDPRSRELLTLYLEGDGFEVEACGDGLAGMETARRVRPDAIVLDIMLPDLSGWDFLRLVKGDDTTARIPVVVVSMLDERGKGLALGAAGYLVKPVGRDDLLATLRPITAAQVGGGPCKVLTIDDDPVAIKLIETVLGEEGFTVVGARSGDEGLRAAQTELPSLIILDLLMPGTDGFEVVERLRADPSTAQIPVVILTAKTIAPEEHERLAAHAAHQADKASFSPAEFVELVRRFCGDRVG
jgi:signal transduction histidine kinase/DNA-binding response OmpR family regulator